MSQTVDTKKLREEIAETFFLMGYDLLYSWQRKDVDKILAKFTAALEAQDKESRRDEIEHVASTGNIFWFHKGNWEGMSKASRLRMLAPPHTNDKEES